MPAVSELAAAVGVRPACEALHVPRASYYRWQQRAGAVVEANPRPRPVRALTTAEQENVLARLHEERFQDRSPAAAPNQLWSWDITKLMGPAKWTYFHLYVVGWMVAPRESAELAKRLIEDSCAKQNIQPGELTVHADRGSPMTSKNWSPSAASARVLPLAGPAATVRTFSNTRSWVVAASWIPTIVVLRDGSY